MIKTLTKIDMKKTKIIVVAIVMEIAMMIKKKVMEIVAMIAVVALMKMIKLEILIFLLILKKKKKSYRHLKDGNISEIQMFQFLYIMVTHLISDSNPWLKKLHLKVRNSLANLRTLTKS